MPGMETIASILERDFTMFTEALRFVRVFDFLDKEDVSRTVFVPTDEAFSAQIPDDLFACLMYMRLPLSDLVLYHIAEGADYTSSLSLREFTYTLLRSHAIRLTTSPEGNITFSTDPPSNIIVANIPASNGVIHVVDNVLIPPGMDFGMCQDFVPTTPPTMPPTTPVPITTAVEETTEEGTTEEMTTEEVTTEEVTTEEVTTDPEMTTPPVAGGGVTGFATPSPSANIVTPDLRRNP